MHGNVAFALGASALAFPPGAMRPLHALVDWIGRVVSADIPPADIRAACSSRWHYSPEWRRRRTRWSCCGPCAGWTTGRRTPWQL